MKSVVAFLCGLLFAVGLVLSGMTLPAKIIGFLDIFGDWDPSLAFVMGGAVMVHLGFQQLFKNRKRPLFDTEFHLPARTEFDYKLFGGAAIFGVGWGLSGFCPGPAIVSLVTVAPESLLFFVGMVLGILMYRGLGAIYPAYRDDS